MQRGARDQRGQLCRPFGYFRGDRGREAVIELVGNDAVWRGGKSRAGGYVEEESEPYA